MREFTLRQTCQIPDHRPRRRGEQVKVERHESLVSEGVSRVSILPCVSVWGLEGAVQDLFLPFAPGSGLSGICH